MEKFFSIDDGLSFMAVSLIHSFGMEQKGSNEGGTWIRLHDKQVFHIPRPVDEVAEMLGAVNLHY